jgi:hypothetical protein
MTYAEVFFELKRLAGLASEYNFEFAEELYKVINEHEAAQGDCCG